MSSQPAGGKSPALGFERKLSQACWEVFESETKSSDSINFEPCSEDRRSNGQNASPATQVEYNFLLDVTKREDVMQHFGCKNGGDVTGDRCLTAELSPEWSTPVPCCYNHRNPRYITNRPSKLTMRRNGLLVFVTFRLPAMSGGVGYCSNSTFGSSKVSTVSRMDLSFFNFISAHGSSRRSPRKPTQILSESPR